MTPDERFEQAKMFVKLDNKYQKGQQFIIDNQDSVRGRYYCAQGYFWWRRLYVTILVLNITKTKTVKQNILMLIRLLKNILKQTQKSSRNLGVGFK